MRIREFLLRSARTLSILRYQCGDHLGTQPRYLLVGTSLPNETAEIRILNFNLHVFLIMLAALTVASYFSQ